MSPNAVFEYAGDRDIVDEDIKEMEVNTTLPRYHYYIPRYHNRYKHRHFHNIFGG